MNRPVPEGITMNRHRPIALIAVLVAASALVGACGASSGPLGSVLVASASPEPSVAQGSPDLTAGPSDEPSSDPGASPEGSLDPASATPSPTPASSGT